MTPEEFVKTYLPYAKASEEKTGIHHLFILAQAVQESGWGRYAPGNNFFGVKSFSEKDNRQLITTTEYLAVPDKKFPEVLSVTKVGNLYLYKVKDWFKVYDSPEESFTEHGEFFLQNPRYSEALKYKSDPYRFAEEVAKAGYATDVNYANNLKAVIDSVKRRVASYANSPT